MRRRRRGIVAVPSAAGSSISVRSRLPPSMVIDTRSTYERPSSMHSALAMLWCHLPGSIRERPEPDGILEPCPQPIEAVRLPDDEDDDQRAEDDLFDEGVVRLDARPDLG